MRIAVGSDERTHLTDAMIEELRRRDHEVFPFGPFAGGDEEWARWGFPRPRRWRREGATREPSFCRTGTEGSIKVPGVRAALCLDAESARGSRRWNHANVLVTSEAVAREILVAWLSTPYGEEDVDLRNVRRIEEIERTHISSRREKKV